MLPDKGHRTPGAQPTTATVACHLERLLTERTITTAAHLNLLIEEYIDSRPGDGHHPHTGVYLHEADQSGCNWNIGVNSDGKARASGPALSTYLDQLRSRYVILADDPTAVPAYLSRRSRSAAAIAVEPGPPEPSIQDEPPSPLRVR